MLGIKVDKLYRVEWTWIQWRNVVVGVWQATKKERGFSQWGLPSNSTKNIIGRNDFGILHFLKQRWNNYMLAQEKESFMNWKLFTMSNKFFIVTLNASLTSHHRKFNQLGLCQYNSCANFNAFFFPEKWLISHREIQLWPNTNQRNNLRNTPLKYPTPTPPTLKTATGWGITATWKHCCPTCKPKYNRFTAERKDRFNLLLS